MEKNYDNPYMVVTDDWSERTRGYLATPMLISVGRGEAWNYGGAWRLRDDKFDAEFKPADVPYTRVKIVQNPDYRGSF